MNRHVALTVACALALNAAAVGVLAQDADEEQADDSEEQAAPAVLDFTMTSLTGQEVDLSQYLGRVVLIVNTASKCGHTPQYADLQALHEQYAEQGLAVLGFPCNQFGNQEPGSDEEILQFCQQNYGVTFDMFSKIDVNDDDAAPLYAYLTSEDAPIEDQGPIQWNFEKFLVDREGNVIARFRSGVNPQSDEMIDAIEAALAQDDAAGEPEPDTADQ